MSSKILWLRCDHCPHTLSAAALCILSLPVVRIVVLFKGCVQIDLYHLITFTMIAYTIVLSRRPIKVQCRSILFDICKKTCIIKEKQSQPTFGQKFQTFKKDLQSFFICLCVM